MRVLKVIAVATLFCTVRVGHGTSFYFVHNGDAIYIAGDTFLSGPPSELNLAPNCKMVVSKRYVTVLTGSLGITKVSWSKDHKVPIGRVYSSLPRKVGAVIDQPGDAKTKIAQLTKALESAIQMDYDIMIKNGSPPLETNVTIGVGLFWFEGKTAMVEIVFVDGHLGHKIQYQVEPVQIIELRPNHLMALSHQEALRAPNPPSTSEIMFTPDKALDWFLNTQSQMTPKLVQPPFTMFRLTPSGGAWIENGDICKDNSHL